MTINFDLFSEKAREKIKKELNKIEKKIIETDGKMTDGENVIIFDDEIVKEVKKKHGKI